MFSLQRFFGKQDTFFFLLEKSLIEASKCSKSLKQLLGQPHSPAILHEIRESRTHNKQHADEVSELAVRTFVTALDREDIEALAAAFYKIPKPMEKFAERLHSLFSHVEGFSFHPQVDTIEYAIERVQKLLEILKTGGSIEVARKINAELQTAEAEADRLVNELFHDLVANHVEAYKVIILRDLYDLLERSIDRCRDSGNVILHICLKYS